MSNNTELKAPAGWKLVPVEPTKAMLEAGYAGAANYSGQDEELGCWRAMLAAVPATPAQQALSDLECPPDPETVDAATVQQAAPSLTVGDEPLTTGRHYLLTPEYGAAMVEMAKHYGMSVDNVLRAAIRLYQANMHGSVKIEHVLKSMLPDFSTVPQPDQAPATFTYTGQKGRDLEDAFEGFNFGTKFYLAQPAAQAEPVAVKFACWDADNGMETFDTHAEALEYATATLSYYRDDAKSDGEWPGDVDSMWVGAIHITHKPAATMPDDDGGVDYALQPVSTQPAAQGLGKEEPDKWAQYVAGMVVAYLGGGVDDERIKPIAGVIESRLWALQPDAGTSVAVPAGLARSDAEFWLRHRAAIIAALQEAGLSIVSGANGASLMRLGKAEAQGAQAPTAEPRHALPDDEIHNPYQYSRGSAKVWLNGFRAGERAHGIAAMASQKE